MILIDANLLIYAFDSVSPYNSTAQSWLDEQLSGSSAVGIPWETFSAFLRIVTNPRIYPGVISIAEAWEQVRDWLQCEAVWTPMPTERHAGLLAQMLRVPGLRANDVPDAHLAALAISHGLILCSADAGFARFPGLRWTNPLAV